MPQIAKRSSIQFILNALKDLSEDQIIRVENHKNDRFLEFRKTADRIEVKEDGYSSLTHSVHANEIKSLLGRLIDYEFPRSHKLRIKVRKQGENVDYTVSPWSARKIS